MEKLGKKQTFQIDTVETLCACYCEYCECPTCWCHYEGEEMLLTSIDRSRNWEYVYYPEMDTMQY